MPNQFKWWSEQDISEAQERHQGFLDRQDMRRDWQIGDQTLDVDTPDKEPLEVRLARGRKMFEEQTAQEAKDFAKWMAEVREALKLPAKPYGHDIAAFYKREARLNSMEDT